MCFRVIWINSQCIANMRFRLNWPPGIQADDPQKIVGMNIVRIVRQNRRIGTLSLCMEAILLHFEGRD